MVGRVKVKDEPVESKAVTRTKRKRYDEDDTNMAGLPTKKIRKLAATKDEIQNKNIDRLNMPSQRLEARRKNTQDCDICAETKPISRKEFPVIGTCDHDASVCSDCYEQHFVVKIEANRATGWNSCDCPLCGEVIEPQTAQSILPKKVSRSIDAMIMKATKQAAPNWFWCPAKGCGHGQLHKLHKGPRGSCSRCHTKICFNHQRLWHTGMTCQEFDTAGDQDQAEAKNVLEIKRTTKPCPFCKIRIKKEGGCNAMVCASCRKNWMWNDVPFDGELQGNSAESAGGPQIIPVLDPDERAVVEQVMQYTNAEIYYPPPPPLMTPFGFGTAAVQNQLPPVRAGETQGPTRQANTATSMTIGLGYIGTAGTLMRHLYPINTLRTIQHSWQDDASLGSTPAIASVDASTRNQVARRPGPAVRPPRVRRIAFMPDDGSAPVQRRLAVRRAAEPETGLMSQDAREVIDLTNDDDADDRHIEHVHEVIDLTGDD